jgi:hypothetical protein
MDYYFVEKKPLTHYMTLFDDFVALINSYP